MKYKGINKVFLSIFCLTSIWLKWNVNLCLKSNIVWILFHLFYVFMSIYLLRIRFMCIFIPSLLAWRSYCSLICMLMTSEWINPIYIYYKSCISFSVHKFYGHLLQIICRILCVRIMSNSFILNEEKLYLIFRNVCVMNK